MKPTTLFALLGVISGLLIEIIFNLDFTLIIWLTAAMILLNSVLFVQNSIFIVWGRILMLFSLFFIFSLFNTFIFQQVNNFKHLVEISNKPVFGEIIQVKTNQDHYNTYQIKTEAYFDHGAEKSLQTKLLVICKSNKTIPIGHNILFKTELNPFENEVNPGAFDAKSYYKNHNFSGIGFLDETCIIDLGESNSLIGYFNRWQNFLGKEIDKQFSSSESGVAKALILGDKNSIDPETISSFSNTGAMHVLAVSGLHVGILLYILQFVFGRFYRVFTKRQALILALICIWIFTFLSGASPSVLRSAVMFSCISLGQLLYRETSSMNTLFLSAILLLSYNPYFFFDIGFQLSYLALIGIFLFQKNIQGLFAFSNKIIQWVWEGTAIGIAATIATTPLMLLYFHQFPNYFLLSNISVMILGFALLLILTLFLVLHAVPYLNWLFALIGSWLVYLLVYSIDFVDKIPGAVSAGFQIGLPLVCLSLLLIFTWNYVTKKALKKIQFLSVVVLFIVTSFNRNDVIQTNQILVFNSTKLCIAIQQNGKAYLLHDPNIRAKKIDQYKQNYEHFYGTPIEQILVLKDSNNVKISDNHLSVVKAKDGYTLTLNNQIFNYYTRYPDYLDSSAILNSILYKKLKGSTPQKNVVLPI